MKTNRNFEFVLTVNNNAELPILDNELSGEVMFKSECHYYAEKEIVSYMKDAARENRKDYVGSVYTIYKVGKTTQETTVNEDGSKTIREIPGTAMLVETITWDGETITIR